MPRRRCAQQRRPAHFNTICIAYAATHDLQRHRRRRRSIHAAAARAPRRLRQEYEAVRKSFDRYIRRHVDEAKLAKVRSMDWLRPDDGR